MLVMTIRKELMKRWFEAVPGRPGEPGEELEGPGTLEHPGRTPRALLSPPGPSSLSPDLPLETRNCLKPLYLGEARSPHGCGGQNPPTSGAP